MTIPIPDGSTIGTTVPTPYPVPYPSTINADNVRKYLLTVRQNNIAAARSVPLIRIWDQTWQLKTVLLGEIDASFEEKLNDTGTGQITLFGTHPLKTWLIIQDNLDADIHCTVDSAYKKRWSGKCSQITYKSDDKGFTYLVLMFLSEYEHVKKVICYSNPLLPPEFQFPKMYIWAGPSIFGIKSMIFLNLLRRFLPLWRLPENIFDPASWLANLNPANWPIMCMPGDFFSDTSEWCVLGTRFGNLHDVISYTLKSAKLHLTATRWLPGDPQPASSWFVLTQPTLVLDIINKSGFSGPTGTVLDGLLETLSTVLATGVSEVQQAILPNASPLYQDPTFFGTVQSSPWVVWRSGMVTGLSGIQTWEMDIHKPLAVTIVTGGKSPGWVNDAVNVLANTVIGYLGALLFNASIGAGLLDSTIDDVILAFAAVTDPFRVAAMGTNCYGEHWAQSTDTAYSLSMIQDIVNGFWETRGYTSFKVNVINGAPYWVGKDFDLGDRVGAEIGDTGYVYVDNVYTLKLSWSRTQDPRWDITIGNGLPKESPVAFLAHQFEQIRHIVQGIGVSS
jgi:hypothetical protein